MSPQDIAGIALTLVFFCAVWIALELRTKAPPPKTRTPRPRSTKAPVKGDLLRSKDVSKLLGIPVSTLQNMREKGVGPSWFRDGKPIYYRRADVEAWMLLRRQAGDAPVSVNIHAFRLEPSPHQIRNPFLGDDDPADEGVRA